MSLLKPFVSSPSRIAANRRNAQKSTGPRSARGKANSRLNRLRTGGRSRLFQDLVSKLANAPPGGVVRTARAALTPDQAAHPLFAQMVRIFSEADRDVSATGRRGAYPDSQKDCF